MRHIAITLGTAAALIAAYLVLRSLGTTEAGGGPLRTEPEVRQPEGGPATREPPVAPGNAAVIEGVSELEALHRQHGAVGDAMRSFLALTRGVAWTSVDRGRMQQAIHDVRAKLTESDVPYLLDLFNRTTDPSFRWWFSWLVQQVPDPRFVEALTEVYRIDPHRAIDALAAINSPVAMERYLKLLDVETDPEVRQHAVVTLAHTDWEGRDDAVVAIARDETRSGGERLEALTALGRITHAQAASALLMEVALGPKRPLSGLAGALASSHPVPDLRSGAILALMLGGDQEALRRLLDAADAAGADPDLTRMVDLHLAAFKGPDLSELIYERARRRGYVSAGEVHHLLRDPERVDRVRLTELAPLVRDPEARRLLDQVVSRR